MLFGSDFGERDELLFSCPIKVSACKERTRIFTGRWGSGKSAHLFLANKELSQFLAAKDHEKRKLWYVDENSLDVKGLLALRDACGDKRDFRVQVEQVWRAEIVRAASVLLGYIAQTHSVADATHWTFVRAAYKGGECAEPIWRNMRPLLQLMFGEGARAQGAEELTGRIQDMTARRALTLVQRCLSDIDKGMPPIGIGVEPIDSPKSPLEQADPGVAQDVIAALTNSFLNTFQPDQDNRLNVYLAIPWHRYSVDGIVNPHWRDPFEAHLLWDKDELLSFISARISSEFDRVGRSYQRGDEVWTKLFAKSVKNTHCTEAIDENTFDYVLRHTHHRPRDVQRICRRAVEMCADKAGRSVDDVVLGRSGLKVDGSHIHAAVNEYCNDQMQYFQEEARRRIPEMTVYENAIRGIEVPFTVDSLAERAKRFGITVTVDVLLRALWETGYVGLEARCKNHCDHEEMRNNFPDRVKVVNKTRDGNEYTRWYLFSYNWKGNPFDQIAMFEGHDNVEVRCVLHPRTFESFTRRVTRDWPIGI